MPSSATSAIGNPSLRYIGHVLESRISEVAAGDLAGAFQQVSDHGAPPEARPVFHRPIEFMDQGGQKHRRIGGAARYDHVSTGRQGLYNRPGPKVGIGRDEPVAERGDSLPGVVEEVAARRALYQAHHLP